MNQAVALCLGEGTGAKADAASGDCINHGRPRHSLPDFYGFEIRGGFGEGYWRSGLRRLVFG